MLLLCIAYGRFADLESSVFANPSTRSMASRMQAAAVLLSSSRLPHSASSPLWTVCRRTADNRAQGGRRDRLPRREVRRRRGPQLRASRHERRAPTPSSSPGRLEHRVTKVTRGLRQSLVFWANRPT